MELRGLPALAQQNEQDARPETAVAPQGYGELIMVVENDMMLRTALTKYLDMSMNRSNWSG